jgi:hypothetical protein
MTFACSLCCLRWTMRSRLRRESSSFCVRNRIELQST